jgi:hypothetical protein
MFHALLPLPLNVPTMRYMIPSSRRKVEFVRLPRERDLANGAGYAPVPISLEYKRPGAAHSFATHRVPLVVQAMMSPPEITVPRHFIFGSIVATVRSVSIARKGTG